MAGSVKTSVGDGEPNFRFKPDMTHSQMLGKVEYGLPAKI